MAGGTLRQTQLIWKAVSLALAKPGAVNVAISLGSHSMVCVLFLVAKK